MYYYISDKSYCLNELYKIAIWKHETNKELLVGNRYTEKIKIVNFPILMNAQIYNIHIVK